MLSSIENDAHDIEKLLLKTQVSLTSFLHSEVNKLIQHSLIYLTMVDYIYNEFGIKT
jgi:hypothetical protein